MEQTAGKAPGSLPSGDPTMIQISTTPPASWPGATPPLTAPTRPVTAVTPVAPVGAATSAQADQDPGRTRRRGGPDAQTGAEASATNRDNADTATRLADAQVQAEQRRAEQEAREAQEAADREAIERLRQVLVDTWDASAAVVERALNERESGAAGAGTRALSLYDEATLGGSAPQAGQIINRRV